VVISCDLEGEKEFDDTRGVNRIRISKNRQHNGYKLSKVSSVRVNCCKLYSSCWLLFLVLITHKMYLYTYRSLLQSGILNILLLFLYMTIRDWLITLVLVFKNSPKILRFINVKIKPGHVLCGWMSGGGGGSLTVCCSVVWRCQRGNQKS